MLFGEGKILKLADFGLAISLREERANTRAGGRWRGNRGGKGGGGGRGGGGGGGGGGGERGGGI